MPPARLDSNSLIVDHHSFFALVLSASPIANTVLVLRYLAG
ncbi:hypothetical protein T11_845 [Trichinella zimbabwensis]|uniref:Uncharacterized protein n=1 Tax=Trichinella zimbabwensis TaxID=268475 RepID=A0A0V1DPA6_9BILA|nr:hypothetical protein T11_845 [Trichinella zimbabwensis]